MWKCVAYNNMYITYNVIYVYVVYFMCYIHNIIIVGMYDRNNDVK